MSFPNKPARPGRSYNNLLHAVGMNRTVGVSTMNVIGDLKNASRLDRREAEE